MQKKEIIYAFIDSQNLNLGVLSQDWKLDFARFRVYLKEKYSSLLRKFAPFILNVSLLKSKLRMRK